jgi:hypothetical protein
MVDEVLGLLIKVDVGAKRDREQLSDLLQFSYSPLFGDIPLSVSIVLARSLSRSYADAGKTHTKLFCVRERAGYAKVPAVHASCSSTDQGAGNGRHSAFSSAGPSGLPRRALAGCTQGAASIKLQAWKETLPSGKN